MQGPLSNPHAASAAEVLKSLDVDPSLGLTDSEVSDRLRRYGLNRLSEPSQTHLAVLLFRQLRSPIVLLLIIAAVASLLTNEIAEFIAILGVLVINTSIGFFTELRAIRSMQSLRQMTRVTCRVRRNGALVELDAERLVPGDILVLDAGDVLAADARVILVSNLACDESALTGESVPVGKSIGAVDQSASAGDRVCMVYRGCGVTRGTGECVVTGTGMHTALGRIAELVDSASSEHSPLERQLASLSRHLIVVTLALTAMLAAVGTLAGQDVQLMLKAAVALAVAAIPEGLPIVATLTLARGMIRMARRNALIENLPSVETLGATTVILTDKTGTLTENHMRVARVRTARCDYRFDLATRQFVTAESVDSTEQDAVLQQLLTSAVLCNNASYNPDQDSGTGDPMEVALLDAASAAGLDRSQLIGQWPEVAEHAFDSTTRRMATVHAQADADRCFIAVKGAPAAILAIVSSQLEGIQNKSTLALEDATRSQWHRTCEDMAAQGLRVLAIAGKSTRAADADPYTDLTLYGVVALNDPARADISAAIADTRRAGIRVIMVTGDHPATARYIADSVGLTDATSKAMSGSDIPAGESLTRQQSDDLLAVDVFSRVNPEQKLQLIELHQRAGQVVAMTGDGVNDAPALKKADIGIAMGTRGTQVAKEASDMILKDDAFPTIVHAIREGRVIYSNIRRFTVYLLSCNLSEILVVAIAVIAGMPLPLLPLQILFLNLVTDVFPAFALGTIEPGQDVLSRPPRPPGEAILGRPQWLTIVVHGISLASTTLLALWLSVDLLGLTGDAISTVCFCTLALSQLWHLLSMHNWRTGWLHTAIARNRYVWLAVGICLMLLTLALWQPQLASVLRLVRLDGSVWLMIGFLSVVPWLIREVVAMVQRRLADPDVQTLR